MAKQSSIEPGDAQNFGAQILGGYYRLALALLCQAARDATNQDPGAREEARAWLLTEGVILADILDYDPLALAEWVKDNPRRLDRRGGRRVVVQPAPARELIKAVL